MTTCRSLTIAFVATALAGCGSSLTGTYRGDIRVMEGREETDKPGHSLAETRDKFAKEGRSITLLPNGRAMLRSVENTVEGDWRVEGNKLIILDDTANGKSIHPGLRMEHKFTLGSNGELIRDGSHNAYNLEEFYAKE